MQDPSQTPPSLPPTESSLPGQSFRVPFLKRIHPLLFVVLSLIAVFFLYQVVAGLITLVIVGGEITPLNTNLIRWATVGGQLLFMLVPTLLLLRARHDHLRPFLHLYVPDYRELLLTVVGVFALQQILQGYMALQDAIPLPPEVRQYVDFFKKLYDETSRTLAVAHSVPEFLFVVFTVAIVPAIAEETLFRGLVQGEISNITGGLRAAVVAGIIFAAYHLNPFDIVPLAALGIYFGYIAFRSQNLVLAMSAHFFNNFVACVALFLEIDDNFIALAPHTEPTMGLVILNSLFFTLVFIMTITAFHRITSHHDDDQSASYE